MAPVDSVCQGIHCSSMFQSGRASRSEQLVYNHVYILYNLSITIVISDSSGGLGSQVRKKD